MARSLQTPVDMPIRRFRKTRFVAGAALVTATMIWACNTSRLADSIGHRPVLFAHRGLGQDFDRRGLDGKTCTAARMLPSGHEFLENTIPSMRAAFELGADFVEFDVHRTADDRFAVFHDWTVDCRTEGSGVTREHRLEELQRLDVGHGYTPDGGRSWPFRGRGVGMMPSLEQVLKTFPDRNFVVDVKSNDADEGALLAERLAHLIAERDAEIVVFGGPAPIERVRDRLPDVRTISRPRLKRCLKRYIALGWSGHVPRDCRRTVLFVPANVAPWLWGWPNRFMRRMDAVGTRVVMIGDYGGGGLSSGFDDPSRIAELPGDFGGGIWTDRIDRIGPAVRRRYGSPAAHR
jgi:glycerophosphoryl diester phosphodiesterase